MAEELRLALAMRGGVSLAVWIGGSVAEIDRVRRAEPRMGGVEDPAQRFWNQVLGASGYENVVVDVLAGASAGGLNGVLYAASQVYGFDYDDIRDVWLQLGGLEALTRTSGDAWPSLLKGDAHFLKSVETKLVELAAGPSHGETAQQVALVLSATLLEPVSRPVPSPTDEELRDRRHASGFRFQSTVYPWLASSFPPAVGESSDRGVFERAMGRLALAARATSSFPAAFEAAKVVSRRRGAFGDPAVDKPYEHDGTFLDRDGAPAVGDVGPMFPVADGGILDNIPISRALDAVTRSPSAGPSDRVLVYVEPSGPARPKQSTARGTEGERRSTVAVLKGTVASRIAGENINADIEAIEAYNEAISRARSIRSVSLDGVGGRADLELGAANRWGIYRETRSSLEAEQRCSLLHDPLEGLGYDPFPQVVGGTRIDDDEWRSPIARWRHDARERLDTSLRNAMRRFLPSPSAGPATVVFRSAEPLERVTLLLLEWVRHLERSGVADLGDRKGALYRILTFVDEVLIGAEQQAWVAAAALIASTDRTERTDLPIDIDERFSSAMLTAITRLHEVEQGACDAVREALRASDGADVLGRAVRDAYLRIPDVAAWVRDVVVLDEGPEDDAAGGAGLIPMLADELATIADAVARAARSRRSAGAPQEQVEPDEAALALAAALSGTGPVTVDHLAALEVLCLPEFVSGLPGRRGVRFVRCSAANRTPLAADFVRLKEKAAETGELWDPDRPADDQGGIPVLLKLAGNELGNFSAFLLDEWRANDWLWGRFDAVTTLVDLLVRPIPLAAWLRVGGGSNQVKVDRFQRLLCTSEDKAWEGAVLKKLWTPELQAELLLLLRTPADELRYAPTEEIRSALIAARQWAVLRHERTLPTTSPAGPPVDKLPTFAETQRWVARYAVGAETIASKKVGAPPEPDADPDELAAQRESLDNAFGKLATAASEAVVWNLGLETSPVPLPGWAGKMIRRAGPRLGRWGAHRYLFGGSGVSKVKLIAAGAVALIVAVALGLALDTWAFVLGFGAAFVPLAGLVVVAYLKLKGLLKDAPSPPPDSS